MKENREILNEAFFKKGRKSRKELLNLPQYEPADAKGASSFFAVSDTDEVKKRLSGTFNVAFGNNSVKSMASKAIKQFPILVSDNVEPETVVMLKKLMEDQYAEYISLLVSNQVIDLSEYPAGSETGNIAIQALNKLSGNEFSKAGNISDDIFRNKPIISFLREDNNVKIRTSDRKLNALLEDSIIVPSEYSDSIVKFIQENASDVAVLNEDPTPRYPRSDTPTLNKSKYANPNLNPGSEKSKGNTSKDDNPKKVLLRRYMMDNFEDEVDIQDKALARERNLDIKRGFIGLDAEDQEIYTKLTTADIVIDKDKMNRAINRSVGQILTDPENVEIRDRFEKATFLLQARKIAGIEYYNYLTLRLGIPVSDAARESLLKNFRISDIRRNSLDNKDNTETLRLSDKDIKDIAKNRTLVEPIINEICKPSIGATLAAGLGGGAIGGGTAAAIVGSTAITGPLMLGVLAGCAVGSGAYLLYSLIKKRKARKNGTYATRNEGWERVEALIIQMEASQADIRERGKGKDIERYTPINRPENTDIDISKNLEKYDKLVGNIATASDEEYDNAYKTVTNMITRALSALTESANHKAIFTQEAPKNYIYNLLEDCKEIDKEISSDKELQAEMLAEATIYKGTSPMMVRYVEKKPGKDVLLTPSSISARTNFAYGSTEIERRDNKDRRYDQPLILTVKFKERFSDGKFSDNELTAVIGILGKVIRIPSAEMAYVLKENNEGNTLDGFFKTGIINNISDILSLNKVSKDLKGMPQSADIWHNLEKVSTIAAANKISGKRTNNVSNAHIIFSQKEIDDVRSETGVDYSRDMKKVAALMKRYSALTIMVANDPGQRVSIFDDQDNISWNVVPYTALVGKDSGDQLSAALSKAMRERF